MPVYLVRLVKRGRKVPCKGEEGYKRGDKVVVESEFGPTIGEVLCEGDQEPVFEIKGPFQGDEKEIERYEEEALRFCQKKALQRGLSMRFVKCEKILDDSKIVFYFVAPTRVDFRELLKDLAKRFKRRIELRQIGIRDAVKMVGGIGLCGKEVCCTRFLENFESVTVKMAKDQNLILNPDKISGICGKLLCCLIYEHEFYEEEKKHFPPLGTEVEFYGSKGTVVGYNVLDKSLIVEDDSMHKFLVKLSEVKVKKEEKGD